MPMDCTLRLFSVRRVTAFCLTSLLLSGGVFALPTGGQVAQGSGSISQNGTNMVIDQNSQNMVINWNTFNINNGESVNFNQPNSSAIAVNRVTTQNASQILGNLNANGQVFVINPNGVVFGKNAQVRVGGLVASTRDISDKDFLAKNYTFSGVSTAGIVNNGNIDVSNGGYVALLGASVTNNGTVKAQNGNVSMAAGKQITLQLNNDSLLGLTVDQGALNAAVQNHGLIQANNGKIYLTAKAAQDLTSAVVNNDGEIDADGINTDGGTIKLVADGGTTTTSGKISATGKHGGSVQVLSDYHAGVMGGSIDVSGTNGGGSIRVGGGLHGTENDIQNASVSYIAKDAVLNADATDNGNGGSVVVWGNEGNNFFGHISARGGKNGGNGGSVETSSHHGLNVNGFVDTSATHGKAGDWLLDPYNVTIAAVGVDPFVNPFTATADSTIAAADVSNALDAGGDVTIFTGNAGGSAGNITIDAGLLKSGGSASTLYLEAAGSIIDNAGASNLSLSSLSVNYWANYGGATASTTYTAGGCTTCDVTFNGAALALLPTDSVDIRTSRNVILENAASISAGTVAINSAAAVTESANSGILATTLSGSITGAADFAGTANSISTLNGFTSSGFNLVDASALTIQGNVGGTGADTTIQTTGTNDITLSSGASIRGNNITLASGNNFINNAGSSVFTLGAGRWLVWSKAPGNDTLGGLVGTFSPQYSSIYGTTTPPATGNGFLYSSAAPTPLPIGNNAQNATEQGKRSVMIEASEIVNAPVESKARESQIPKEDKRIKQCVA